MRYLLDTHVILWMFENDSNLSKSAHSEIENVKNECFVSVVSLYEIAIKKNIGKLDTSNSITTFAIEIKRVGINLLPIEVAHLETYLSIPPKENHKDPFDRLLIATAICENLMVITADEKFSLYDDLIEVKW